MAEPFLNWRISSDSSQYLQSKDLILVKYGLYLLESICETFEDFCLYFATAVEGYVLFKSKKEALANSGTKDPFSFFVLDPFKAIENPCGEVPLDLDYLGGSRYHKPTYVDRVWHIESLQYNLCYNNFLSYFRTLKSQSSWMEYPPHLNYIILWAMSHLSSVGISQRYHEIRICKDTGILPLTELPVNIGNLTDSVKKLLLGTDPLYNIPPSFSKLELELFSFYWNPEDSENVAPPVVFNTEIKNLYIGGLPY